MNARAELDRAVALQRNGHPEQAASIYRRLLAGRRNDPHLRTLLGTALCEAGQCDEGMEILRGVLARHPDHPEALNNLAAILLDRGRHEEAAPLLDRLLAARPDHPQALINRAVAARRSGDAVRARACSAAVLARDPGHRMAAAVHAWALGRTAPPEETLAWIRRWLAEHGDHPALHHTAGVVLFEQGRHREALASFRRAAELEPEQPEHLYNVATVAAILDAHEGREAYRHLLALAPDHQGGLLGYGNLLLRMGEYEEAEEVSRRALALAPDSFPALVNLAGALRRLDRAEEARALYEQALDKAPGHPDVLAQMGTLVLEVDGDRARALAMLREAHRTDPHHIAAGVNLSDLLLREGRFDEALEVIERVAEAWPESAEVRWQRALVLLLHGRLREGFAAYQARFGHGHPGFPGPVPEPVWDGRPLDGARIMVHPEQGLGDMIQFVRHLEQVRALGGTPVLPTPQPLRRLFTASLEGVELVPERGRIPVPDWHTALLSLPHVLGTDLDTIPARIPYLRVPPELVAAWGRRIPPGEGLRVGIAWAGNPRHRHDARRSVPADAFARLGAVPGVTLFSLQVGERGTEVEALRAAGIPVVDLTADIVDMADTAALMMHLDLVISVDTSVVHLAGALGRPVWTLLQLDCDWRWMLRREDSPWYPTMRLFRQSRPDDWEPVFERVEEALRALVAQRTAETEQAVAESGPWRGIGALLPAGARPVVAGATPEEIPLPEEATALPPETVEAGTCTHLVIPRAEEAGALEDLLERVATLEAETILGIPKERLEPTVQALLRRGLGVRAAECEEGRCYLLLERRPALPEPPSSAVVVPLDASLPGRMAPRLWGGLLPPGTELLMGGPDGARAGIPLVLATGGLDAPDAEALAGLGAADGSIVIGCFPASVSTPQPPGLRLRLSPWAADRGPGPALHLGVWPLAVLSYAPRPEARGVVTLTPTEVRAADPDTLAQRVAGAEGVVAVGADAVLLALAAARRLQWHPDPQAPARSARAVRALLVEVLGRAFPPGTPLEIDREAVRRYRVRLTHRMEALRRGLAELLATGGD